MRARLHAVADDTLARDEAHVEVTLADGRVLAAHVAHARGSTLRPMSDAELDAKFMAQAEGVLSRPAGDELLSMCRHVGALRDVGREIGARLP
jgi:2-methylcitrate dehydratase PrpD